MTSFANLYGYSKRRRIGRSKGVYCVGHRSGLICKSFIRDIKRRVWNLQGVVVGFVNQPTTNTINSIVYYTNYGFFMSVLAARGQKIGDAIGSHWELKKKLFIS